MFLREGLLGNAEDEVSTEAR